MSGNHLETQRPLVAASVTAVSGLFRTILVSSKLVDAAQRARDRLQVVSDMCTDWSTLHKGWKTH